MPKEATHKYFLLVRKEGNRRIQEFEEYRRKEMLQYESDFDRAIKELKSQADDNTDNTFKESIYAD